LSDRIPGFASKVIEVPADIQHSSEKVSIRVPGSMPGQANPETIPDA
jgi:hypothetical protein